jgi:hypothetical protein
MTWMVSIEIYCTGMEKQLRSYPPAYNLHEIRMLAKSSGLLANSCWTQSEGLVAVPRADSKLQRPLCAINNIQLFVCHTAFLITQSAVS